jgi:hypothetical protein
VDHHADEQFQLWLLIEFGSFISLIEIIARETDFNAIILILHREGFRKLVFQEEFTS